MVSWAIVMLNHLMFSFVNTEVGSWVLILTLSLRWGLILILVVGNGANWLYSKLGNIDFMPSFWFVIR